MNEAIDNGRFLQFSGKLVSPPLVCEKIMASPADEIFGLYQRHAKEWDQGRGRDLFEKPWLDRFLSLLPPNASVLDIGCGGAEPIARYFIEAGHRVTGIDSSPALIDICRERFPELAWFVSDMRSLALGRRFDGLLAWDSFFHLCPEDQREMFEIFRRHAATRAALMFTSGPAHGEAIGSFMGEPLYHGSLSEAEYRLLLDRDGFDLVSHVVDDPTCGHHTVWLARLM
ncbi:MAG: class I SAM-dependent methyltransferase [Isosphaeraceae bacterium]